MFTTNASSGIHNQFVFIRVRVVHSQEIYDLLGKEEGVLDQINSIPYSDGANDNILIFFSCSRAVADECNSTLSQRGYGKPGSGCDFNLIPLSLAKDVRKQVEEEHHAAADEESTASSHHHHIAETTTGEESHSKPTFKSTFKARIAVENMLELVHEGAAFSFDYVMLILVAAVIALIGLVTNSSVSIVASMLVSPLMGPILGFTFATVVRDRELFKVGMISAVLGMCMCIAVGYIGGLFAAPASMRQVPWPTPEMYSRGQWSALYIGAAIAIPSGVGVALSIMGQNTNSLVGVAISASLLPPCVNCGLMFAEATLLAYFYDLSCVSPSGNTVEETMQIWSACCDVRTNLATSSCPPPGAVDFPDFCCSATKYSALQVAEMGLVSLLLTVVNILCIWVFAALMFWFKEVAPLPNKSELWQNMVPRARAFNVAVNRGEISKEEVEKELREYRHERKRLDALNQSYHHVVPLLRNGGLQFKSRSKRKNIFSLDGSGDQEEDDETLPLRGGGRNRMDFGF